MTTKPATFDIDGITSKDGLLWRNGRVIDLPEADDVARRCGFSYAEQLVRHLQLGIRLNDDLTNGDA